MGGTGGYGDRQDRGPRDDRGGFAGRPDREGGERRPYGDRPPGDRPRPQGDRPQGDRPYGDRPRFDADRPRRPDDRFGGDRPRQGGDDRYQGGGQGGDRPRFEDRPRFDGDRARRPDDRYGNGPGRAPGARPYGDRPYGDRPQGDRPYGDRPQGNRGYGDRPQGDRPRFDNDRPRRPDDRFGTRNEGSRHGDDRSRYGDGRSRGGHAGDRDRPGTADVHARAERQEYAERTDRPRKPDAPRQPAPTRLAEADAGERLSKRMSELGLASRREADEWIESGWVTVDGKLAELGQRVGPDVKIEVDPAAREQQAQRVTIILNKPIGYVSGQAEDGYEPASVLVKADTHWGEDPSKIHWAPGHGRGLAPAGRLDIDSTGLLVLTQDGRIARHLIGEDSDVEKEYLVRVAVANGDPEKHPQHQLDPRAIAMLNHGLELDGVQLKEAKVSWANEDQLRFVLREGRKRQIRRMCELVGLNVLALKRVRIGRIPLGQLPPGQWRYLAPWERF